MYLVGFDVGGTFIDLFAFDSETGRITVHKVDSSRTRLGEAIQSGVLELLARAGIEPTEVARIAHGTTVVTNQIVERAGARVGLVTTDGFRDVLEIGRMRRSSLTDLGESRPRPLVERDMRLEIAERVTADGAIERPVDADDARRVIAQLVRAGAESIAICTLNAYANGANEQVVADACAEAGVPVSLSSRVAPEFGEYERCATTVLNSYVMPRTRLYLDDVRSRLRGLRVKAPLEIMQSSGGAIPSEVAGTYPVRLIESGPGAGVAAAAQIAREAGCTKIITLDMGGTSADVSVVLDGEPHFISEHNVNELPIRTIGIDVRSIGAGGGSIASIDRTGSLQVGPASAGADPGPACYGQGGEAPTVTDADLVLGYLDADQFCAGTKPLSVDAARRALETLGSPLGASAEEVALGIVRIAVTRMAGAIRTITTQAGHDPRDCTLVGFGGAGPTHAAWVARELDIPDVMIPSEPALLSARGLLMADYRTDAYRGRTERLADADTVWLNEELETLERQARGQLSAAAVGGAGIEVTHTLELCYEGQQDLVPIPLRRFPVEAPDLDDVAARLDAVFLERYGFLPPARIPQLMRLRATAVGVLPRPPVDASRRDSEPAPHADRRRDVYVRESGPVSQPALVVRRDALGVDSPVEGPCIVEEEYSSTLVLPGQSVARDRWGSLRIRPAANGGGER
jgi:N-methylhydantoinase A